MNIDNPLNYDIKSCDISDAREVTIKCNGKRFRIFLELVTSCFGNCNGCSLSFIDNKNISPEINIEQIQKTLSFFHPIINNKNDILTTVVNLGTGDYFMMPDEFLENLSKTLRVFFDGLKTKRNVITISTSLFMKKEKSISKINSLKKYLHKTQFAIDAVIDPEMIHTHYNLYKENYLFLLEHFPFIDLVINISNTTKKDNLLEVIKFLKEVKALNFDLQYALNKTNTYRVQLDQNKFSELLKTAYRKLDNDKSILNLSISIPNIDNHEEFDILTYIKRQANQIVNERVMVDKNGNIFPIAFGFGDIFLNEKYDFPPIGNINNDFVPEKAEEIIFNYLKNVFISNKKCYTCQYNKECYSTGYSFYNKFDSSKNKCENVARYLFENLNNIN